MSKNNNNNKKAERKLKAGLLEGILPLCLCRYFFLFIFADSVCPVL